MTIDEAKKRLVDLSFNSTVWYQPGSFSAIKLGIAALNRIQAGRVAGHILWEDKLPGETQ